MTDHIRDSLSAVRDEMRARLGILRMHLIAEHMDCGATQAQAEECWNEVMNSEFPPLPSLDELDQWAIDNPQTETEAEIDAIFEKEKQEHREQLRERYHKMNEETE